MSLADYQRKFCALYVNSRNGRRSPHKICMLLAMLDLARVGSLKVNRIAYGPTLLERYNHRYFQPRCFGLCCDLDKPVRTIDSPPSGGENGLAPRTDWHSTRFSLARVMPT